MRWLEYVVFLLIVVGLARPAGLYLARVGQRGRTILDPLLCPVESVLHRLLGVRPETEMSAGVYIVCFLLFGAGCAIVRGRQQHELTYFLGVLRGIAAGAWSAQ